jgi:hypothetical protein
MDSKNIIIIGAPRSGTNMLRDILTSFDGVASWPCDEINYIWRHGNIFFPSDELPQDLATPQVARYINKWFTKMRKNYDSSILVEKTCANSLRVPFVDKIIPDAKYIFIYRDGIDATGSAKKRWKAELDIPYILKKIRFVPKTDLPYYAMRYFWARMYRLISHEKRLAFWGPALDDMEDILKNNSLNEVCLLQWKRCVEKANEAFMKMPPDKVIRVCYEDFVRNPNHELQQILKFIGKTAENNEISNAIQNVSSKSIGKGREALGQAEVRKLEPLIAGTLKK